MPVLASGSMCSKVKMAEERPPASLEESPKPKSAQTEKPRRIWEPTEGEEMEIPPSVNASRITPPRPAPLTFLTWSRPTTKISVTASSVKVSTKYQGRLPQSKVQATEISPEKPASHPDQPKSKPSLLQHTESGAKGKDVVHGSSKPVTQPPRTASIPSGVLARETAKELHQKQEEFLQIQQLTKEAEPPPPVVSC